MHQQLSQDHHPAGLPDAASQRHNARHADGRWRAGMTPNGATPWRLGESGNPSGAAVGQTYPGRWLGPLAERTAAELRTILDDPRASNSKQLAARLLLDTGHEDPNVRRRAIAEVLDRTQGKARQTHAMQSAVTPAPRIDVSHLSPAERHRLADTLRQLRQMMSPPPPATAPTQPPLPHNPDQR